MAELELLPDTSFLDDTFKEHLKNRQIIINEEISSEMVEKLILQIIKFNKEDKGLPIESRKPILIYCSSLGGDVLTGLNCIDIIQNSKTPVYGIVLNYAYSMMGLIFLACNKRIMLPSSSLLIHDGQTALSGSNNKVKDLQKFYGKLDEKVKSVVLNNSKITEEEYDENIDRELYLIASECKEKGLCDIILGEDCDIDFLYN